ncbi:type II toxin-antitoxin system HipA family toxin [Micromonospora sp. NBC_01739]|uniref:type II toxin-antitoxin system HipA family toxin n=1 Tax=Micromonospora sp. NBC_01739 TaxID=2975985 RepID=UPI002E1203DE|nr:type II toxin-antitoxin system HipA family toxin [Micromonospora sp. NBC_01739]
MKLSEKFYAVLLHGERIGTLSQRGDFTRFLLNERYLHDSMRPVLGLRFEEALRSPYSSALRLPPWFSNLLPEGPLRQWIAAEREVSLDREMELLAQVGHDLPGAVQIISADGPDVETDWAARGLRSGQKKDSRIDSLWRFSLAGVALKFSMLAQGDRLTIPAVGDRGDWLVKFPDYVHPDVPQNEFAMMSMARMVGIEVPEIRLVHRDELAGLPVRMWPNAEEWAFAIKRFDRVAGRRSISIHIEDFAQVRDVYPDAKYQGSMETVAALAYRGRDVDALREFVRRLTFNILIGNGDAHLKNWSLIYPNGRIPRLSPAYDLVSTHLYRSLEDGPEDLGLRFDKTKRFDKIRISSFVNLEKRLGDRFGKVGADLGEVAAQTVQRVVDCWPACRLNMRYSAEFADAMDEWINKHACSLLNAQ